MFDLQKWPLTYNPNLAKFKENPHAKVIDQIKSPRPLLRAAFDCEHFQTHRDIGLYSTHVPWWFSMCRGGSGIFEGGGPSQMWGKQCGIFEPTCANARRALMRRFPSVRLSVCPSVCLSVCLWLYQKSLDNNSLEKNSLEKKSYL